jgi:hypothetical protein
MYLVLSGVNIKLKLTRTFSAKVQAVSSGKTSFGPSNLRSTRGFRNQVIMSNP